MDSQPGVPSGKSASEPEWVRRPQRNQKSSEHKASAEECQGRVPDVRIQPARLIPAGRRVQAISD